MSSPSPSSSSSFSSSPRTSDPAAAEMKRIESSNNPVDIATLATSGDFHLLASED
jgi:hypothetical protein